MKRTFFAAVVVLLLLTAIFPAAALADASITVTASPVRVEAGETVTVSGTAEASVLLSVKVTDEDDNIISYSVVRASEDGTYQSSFTVPDIDPQMLTVVAGSGSTVATAQVEVFIQQYCTVTFNKNGGDTEASPKTVTVKESETVDSLPVAPVKEGYTFGGWYREKECKTAWGSSDQVTSDITVYAEWMINTYSVKFYQEDGITLIGTAQTVRWGSAATIPVNPVRSGYTFAEWTLTGDDATVETSLSSVKENIIAVASYTKKDTEATKTPSPSASATVTTSSTASASPAVSPSAMATAVPAASATPGFSATSSATPAPSILPVEVKGDENTGIITVVIDVDDLPEGTTSVQLPDGRVVNVSGGGTITLEITDEDLDENGMARITPLDEEGTPLSNLSIQVFQKSRPGIVAILLWGVGGLLIAGIALFVVISRKKRHRS